MRRLVLLAVLATGLAGVQGAAAQSQTGTGGGPSTTATAPNTSPVGRTKPPGSAAGAETTPESTEEARRRPRDDRAEDGLQKGICIGCGPK